MPMSPFALSMSLPTSDTPRSLPVPVIETAPPALATWLSCISTPASMPVPSMVIAPPPLPIANAPPSPSCTPTPPALVPVIVMSPPLVASPAPVTRTPATASAAVAVPSRVMSPLSVSMAPSAMSRPKSAPVPYRPIAPVVVDTLAPFSKRMPMPAGDTPSMSTSPLPPTTARLDRNTPTASVADALPMMVIRPPALSMLLLP